MEVSINKYTKIIYYVYYIYNIHKNITYLKVIM